MEESLSINPISSFQHSKQRSLCIHFWKRRNKMDTPNPETTIDSLFSGKRRFCVPAYQRAYSWQVGGGDQVGQFLNDIREQESNHSYYLGHFLFESQDGNGVFQVIDGQQRLTTIVIFMSALVSECERRGIVKLGETEVGEICETYLEHRLQKFWTVDADEAFFRERIVKRNMQAERTTNRRSERLIAAAADFFAREMREVATDELNAWYDVLKNAVATTYTVNDRENAKSIATQIFAFQNDRGKSLTTLEKTKAWLMHQVYRNAQVDEADDLVRAVESNFSEIYSCTESMLVSEDSVLGWHRQAFLDGNDDSSLDAVKRAMVSASDKIGWIIDFAAKLAQTFRFVVELEVAEERRDSLIADICFLGKSSAMPLLIKLRHHRKIVVSSDGNEVLSLIENILFKLTFTNAGYRTNDLAKYARTYEGSNFDSWLVPSLRNAAVNGFKPYWDFNGSCRKFFEENRYHYIREIKYVLYKYENHLRDLRKEAHLSIDACNGIFRENKSVENTLDHITPQNPDWTVYTESFRRDYLSNIGNLSLLTWSGNASKNKRNPTLPEVRDKYNTPQWSQKEIYEILCTGSWGEKEIDERRQRIVNFVVANWKLG